MRNCITGVMTFEEQRSCPLLLVETELEPRRVSLAPRDEAQDRGGDREQRERADDEPHKLPAQPQSLVLRALLDKFGLVDCGAAGGQKLPQAVAVADLARRVTGDPAFCLAQLDDIEQADAAAAALRPLRGMQLEQPAALLVVAARQEPALELRPPRDQYLVRQVDERLSRRRGIRRQDALGDQLIEDRVDLRGFVPRRRERGARLLPPRVGAVLAEADQAQEDPLGEPLLRRAQVMEHGIGPARQGHGQAAAATLAERLVARQAQQPVAAALPQEHQRLLQERQCPGLGRGVKKDART